MLQLSCTDVAAWRGALAAYPEKIRNRGGEELAELDNFVRFELPESIRGRQDAEGRGAFITKEELENVVRWKLSRGKWRPRLQSMAAAQSEEAVREASGKAFEKMPDVGKGMKELCVLRGVGPATASLLLSLHSPSVAPFMSDEALLAAVGGAKEYTAKKYMEFSEKMMEQCKVLEACEGSSKEKGTKCEPLSVSDMERALWSSAQDDSNANKKSSQGKAQQKSREQEGAKGEKRQRKK